MQNTQLLKDFSLGPIVESAQCVSSFGPTLVVAPHPYIETSGCGGAIALLRQRRLPVSVLLVTDGPTQQTSACHYSRVRLRCMRERETLTALDRLGVLPPSVKFLDLPERAMPEFGEPAFDRAIDRCAEYFMKIQPSTVLLPWRRHTQTNHRAAWELVSATAIKTGLQLRWLEYPTWSWDSSSDDAALKTENMFSWRLDIKTVNTLKQSAIAAYRLFANTVFDDKLRGSSPDKPIQNYCLQPWELYLESVNTV